MRVLSKVEKCWIPWGDNGVSATLDRMAKIVNESIHMTIVRKYAIQAVQGVDGKNRLFQSQAIRKWILQRMSFIRDPLGVEMVHTPENMLLQYEEAGIIYGDCDDMATLSAALGKSIGIESAFVVLGFGDKSKPYGHVYTVLNTGKGWLPVDDKAGNPDANSFFTRKAWRKI